jgi:hypothetical protein
MTLSNSEAGKSTDIDHDCSMEKITSVSPNSFCRMAVVRRNTLAEAKMRVV